MDNFMVPSSGRDSVYLKFVRKQLYPQDATPAAGPATASPTLCIECYAIPFPAYLWCSTFWLLPQCLSCSKTEWSKFWSAPASPSCARSSSSSTSVWSTTFQHLLQLLQFLLLWLIVLDVRFKLMLSSRVTLQCDVSTRSSQGSREFQCILYLPIRNQFASHWTSHRQLLPGYQRISMHSLSSPYWEPFCQSLPGYLMDSSSLTRGQGHITCQLGGKEKEERRGKEKRRGEGGPMSPKQDFGIIRMSHGSRGSSQHVCSQQRTRQVS
jgi:hypothetical protein